MFILHLTVILTLIAIAIPFGRVYRSMQVGQTALLTAENFDPHSRPPSSPLAKMYIRTMDHYMRQLLTIVPMVLIAIPNLIIMWFVITLTGSASEVYTLITALLTTGLLYLLWNEPPTPDWMFVFIKEMDKTIEEANLKTLDQIKIERDRIAGELEVLAANDPMTPEVLTQITELHSYLELMDLIEEQVSSNQQAVNH